MARQVSKESPDSQRAPAASAPSAAGDDLGLDSLRKPPEDVGLSLDQLSAALAGMLNSGSDPYASSPGGALEAGGPGAAAQLPPIAGVDEAAGGDDPGGDASDEFCEVTPRSILEAMLFVGSPQNQPLSSQQVAGLMRGVRPAEIDEVVRELNQEYERRSCPYQIVAEGAGYRLALRPRYDRMRDKFYGKVRQARLSQAAIEVLAAVAYHAPITADDVSRLRGTPSGHILALLVRRQLLRLERSDTRPRKAHYHTTARFLRLFGLSSLEELPRSSDLEQA